MLLLEQVRVSLADFMLEVSAELRAPVTAIFGPSGAGKTSLLDAIAGLRRLDKGMIRLGEKVLSNTATGQNVPARDRSIGYVPQDLALFPHLSVRRNLIYGLKPGQNGVTYPQVTQVLELNGLEERRIHQLSGGERQRVALGRALLSAPSLLLLDEPLASLDAALKQRTIPFLRRLREEFQIPMIYVSHDAAEVSQLCDEVLTLERGRMTGRSLVGPAGFEPATKGL